MDWFIKFEKLNINTGILSYGHEFEKPKASLKKNEDFSLDDHNTESMEVKNYSNTRILSYDHEIEEPKVSLERNRLFLIDF